MQKKALLVFAVVLLFVAVGAWYGGKYQALNSAKADLQGMAMLASVTGDQAPLVLTQGRGNNPYGAAPNWNSGNIIATSNERYLYLIRGGAVYQFDARTLKFIEARTLPNYAPRSYDDDDDEWPWDDRDDDDDDDRDLPWPWN